MTGVICIGGGKSGQARGRPPPLAYEPCWRAAFAPLKRYGIGGAVTRPCQPPLQGLKSALSFSRIYVMTCGHAKRVNVISVCSSQHILAALNRASRER